MSEFKYEKVISYLLLPYLPLPEVPVPSLYVQYLADYFSFPAAKITITNLYLKFTL